MRRKDRQRSEEFAWAVTDRCGWAVLSCVQPDGTPYSVPLSIAREGGRVYFHCAEEGRKNEALRSNPKVCLSCVGDTNPAQDDFSMEYESAILFGTAALVEEREEKIEALRSNPKVCLSCVGDTNPAQDDFSMEYESAILFGTAALVEEREEKIHGLRLISQRYTPFKMKDFDRVIEAALDHTAVWRIDVESITGKARPGLVVK